MASPVTKAEFFFYLVLIGLALPAKSVASTTTLPGCRDKCGNVSIPYPFGTRPGCYRPGFYITCNESTTPPKAFLGTGNLQVMDISTTTAEVRIVNTFIAYRCYDKNFSTYIDLAPPYLFSSRRNRFTAIGCYTLAYITGQGNSSYLSGCVSYCDDLNSTTGDGGQCNGLGCCQTTIAAGLNYYEIQWASTNDSRVWSFNPCSYAMLMQEDWYKFTVQDLGGIGNGFSERHANDVPVVLDWAIRDNGTCNEENSAHSLACQSRHSICNNTANGEGYICKCLQGYEGNPYIIDGCEDIDECEHKDQYNCTGTCTNTDGGYECSCPKGYKGDGKAGNCTKNPENFPFPARVAIGAILGVAFLVGLCFVAIWYKQRRRYIKEKDEYKKYYEMMNTHLRVFSKKQIEIATNNFNEDHIIGIGGHGKVYKGLLDNNKAVAIKKSKEIGEDQREEFVNEIILVSQINHKNVVRLFGCCLEVQIPMLVYEFIPNGTLFDLLHTNSKDRPVSLSTRLRIAMESAEALDYLHSSISHSILHGDVKSANILLDDEYRAKVSDFGASNLVPVDDALIVELVQGTRGYLDPECLCTQIITKKSDVYSFGVVILELITRKKAIYHDHETGEKQHLASCFVSKYSQNKLHDMLDEEIVTSDEKVIEILHEISELAVRCLRVRGEDRPTMKQVVEKLENLSRFDRNLSRWETEPDETDSLLRKSKFYSASDSTASQTTDYRAILEINTERAR